MITVLIFLLILIVLVLIHEFGHFIAAKRNGVLVEEFGFGFPPRIFGIKIGETLYSINLIPLGGFVKLYGEEYHEEKKGVKSLDKIPAHRAFINKTPLQKTVIIAAGVAMNFLLGWVLISFLFTQGVPRPSGVVISKVQTNTPAEKIGLLKGDKIDSISVDTVIIPIVSNDDLVKTTRSFADKEISLTVLRNKQKIPFTVVPRSNPPKGQGSLGIVIEQQSIVMNYPWYTAPYYGLKETLKMTTTIASEILKIPGQLITKSSTDVEVTGPVGIAKIVGEARKFGITALIEIIAILSINLAVVNILPFPALDGGRQVFIFYEWITGKKTNQTLEQYLNLSGIILLLTLSAVITFFDIKKYWG